MIQSVTRQRISKPRALLKAIVDREYIPSLVALESQCFGSYYRPHRYDAADFTYYFRNPNTINIVATVQGELVGYVLGIVGSGTRSHLARIHSIAVHPRFRRQGIATRLINRFLADASKRGCNIVHAEAFASKSHGHQLLTRLGFRPYKRLPHYYGKGIHGVRLRYALEE